MEEEDFTNKAIANKWTNINHSTTSITNKEEEDTNSHMRKRDKTHHGGKEAIHNHKAEAPAEANPTANLTARETKSPSKKNLKDKPTALSAVDKAI